MFYVTFGLLNKYWNRPEDNDATSDSELQSSDSEDSDDSEDDAQSLFRNGRLYRSQYERGTPVPDTDVECVTIQNKLRVQIYLLYICRWWLGEVHHNFGEIWRGVRANLPLLRGGIV